MLSAQKIRAFNLLLTGVMLISGAACRSSGEDANTPAGLVVVNAAKTGIVKRILVREDMEIAENAVLIELAVPSNDNIPAANINRPTADSPMQNQNKLIADAERELQRDSVELQRIEPLVASNSAPQAQLDAARAQYQQAQERLDQLRRAPPQNPQTNPGLQQNNGNFGQNTPSLENIFAVRAPVAGNVRVISARVGQSVKAGEPVATISTVQ